MATTTVQVDRAVRDALAEIAQRDLNGVSLGQAVAQLVEEHEVARVMRQYEQLRADPAAWAEYQAELAEWDAVTGDGLADAGVEYPEYNR